MRPCDNLSWLLDPTLRPVRKLSDHRPRQTTMERKGDCILGVISENIGELQLIDRNTLCSPALLRREATELIALQWMPDVGAKDGRKRYDTTTDT